MEGMRSRYLQEKGQNNKGISNLDIYKKTIKMIALGATLAVVGTLGGKIALDHYIEYDNMRFEQENERYNNEIYELNGSTADEIVERGKSR